MFGQDRCDDVYRVPLIYETCQFDSKRGWGWMRVRKSQVSHTFGHSHANSQGRHTLDAIRQRCAIFHLSKANKSVCNRELSWIWKVDESSSWNVIEFSIKFSKWQICRFLKTRKSRRIRPVCGPLERCSRAQPPWERDGPRGRPKKYSWRNHRRVYCNIVFTRFIWSDFLSSAMV